MSARNFYQTFYQNDSLFRLADDSWEPLVLSTPDDTEAKIAVEPTDLLVELEALSVSSTPADLTSPNTNITQELPVSAPIIPEPAASIRTPEVLPEPPLRPTVPSILPPIQQQPRLPQLNHKVLLLADEELDPSNLLFLEKILKAVNLNVSGVDLLNLNGVQELNFTELLRGKYIHHFITFGVPFERINLDIMMDRYSPVRFEGITFLMADSLPTIEADQNLKKRLWGALQRMFLR